MNVQENSLIQRLALWWELQRMPMLDRIQFEISPHCNASCLYCPGTVYGDHWPGRDLSPDLFQALVPFLGTTRMVHLQGWGEPLLHRDFFDMVDLAKKAECVVSTTTNGMLLDRARLRGGSAVMEERYGRGRVLLSLINFDAPADPNGDAVLRTLWDDPTPGRTADLPLRRKISRSSNLPELSPEFLVAVGDIRSAVADPIESGLKDSLWFWRNSLLLQWQRGVRGLEYGTLAVMIGEIGRRLILTRPVGGTTLPESMDSSRLKEDVSEIRGQIVPFVEKAKDLLARERRFMQLIDIVDRPLFTLIRKA